MTERRASMSAALAYWRSGYGLLLATAIASGAAAWWMIAWPVVMLTNVAEHSGHLGWTFLHMLGGTGMLFLGGFNLYLAGRAIRFPLHRRIGQAYLLLGAVGAVTALAITLSPAHKKAAAPILTNSSISLSMLSLAWLAFAALGWRAARNRRFQSHRDWMIRSYVLVWSFVFCRIVSRVPGASDLGGGEAFIWLSWIAPLILCEIGLQWRHGSQQKRRSPAPAPAAVG
jgi:uncharacterized membrane protein YozB (DUF420 family)